MKYLPGRKAPFSGVYDERNAFGIRVDQITLIKGDSFPPVLHKANYYELYISASYRPLGKPSPGRARKK